MEKLGAHVHRQPEPLGALRPGLPPGLEAIVHRMLAKEPADRPDTPGDTAAALEPYARGADLSSLGDPLGQEPEQYKKSTDVVSTNESTHEHRAHRPDGRMRVRCPHCGRRVKIPPELRGRKLKCRCRASFTIPRDAEASPSRSPSGSPSAARTPSPQPRALNDLDFAALLLEARIGRGAARPQRGPVKKAVSYLRKRSEALKLHRELGSLEQALAASLVELGLRTLETGATGLTLDAEKQQLQGIMTRISDLQERIETLSAIKGTSSLVDELRKEIAQLGKQRDGLLPQIGRVAFTKQVGDSGVLRKVDSLQSVLNDVRGRLDALGPGFADYDALRRTGLVHQLLRPAVWLSLVVAALLAAAIVGIKLME